jgi:hypothetical protein
VLAGEDLGVKVSILRCGECLLTGLAAESKDLWVKRDGYSFLFKGIVYRGEIKDSRIVD